MQIVFRRDASRPELSYVVEGRDDLAAGAWLAVATSTGGAPFVAVGGAVASEVGDGSVRTVTVTDTTTAGAGKRRFLRVRVSE